MPKEVEVRHGWWVVDAEGMTLGRLATELARRIQGKHKPGYTPFLDTGDHVVVVNAAKIRLTGDKWNQKLYRRHSGQPGGLREISAADLLARHPERLLESAVAGMLPKGPRGRRLARKLKVYGGPRHPHDAQQPQPLAVPEARRSQ